MSTTLAAGCSVVVEDMLAEAADQAEAVEVASCLGINLMRFWVGTLPPNLDARLWQTLDADPAALACLAKAGKLQGLVGYRA